MTNIYTKEQREDLRATPPYELEDGADYAALLIALSGLDIADERLYKALAALGNAVAISIGPRSEREIAIQTAWEGANEALDEWDKWKGRTE